MLIQSSSTNHTIQIQSTFTLLALDTKDTASLVRQSGSLKLI